MVEDSKSGETEDNEAREEIKEEVHELQDYESEERKKRALIRRIEYYFECKY
jgi:hypothetical protein